MSFDIVARIDRLLPFAVTSHQSLPGADPKLAAESHTAKGGSDGQPLLALWLPEESRIAITTSDSVLVELVLAARHPKT